jgi:hypothetical protein
MSSPAVETTGTHPSATRRELRRQQRERRVVVAVAAALLLALLVLAALVVGAHHGRSPVSGPPGTLVVPVAAFAP